MPRPRAIEKPTIRSSLFKAKFVRGGTTLEGNAPEAGCEARAFLDLLDIKRLGDGRVDLDRGCIKDRNVHRSIVLFPRTFCCRGNQLEWHLYQVKLTRA